MPIFERTTGIKGIKYYQYGTHGKPYFFYNEDTRKIAHDKAKKQEFAILYRQGIIPIY